MVFCLEGTSCFTIKLHFSHISMKCFRFHPCPNSYFFSKTHIYNILNKLSHWVMTTLLLVLHLILNYWCHVGKCLVFFIFLYWMLQLCLKCRQSSTCNCIINSILHLSNSIAKRSFLKECKVMMNFFDDFTHLKLLTFLNEIQIKFSK